MTEEPVRLASGVAQFEPSANDLAALPNEVELTRRELLGFHQHLLAHAHLAEIVEQGRVADLSHLVRREPDVAEGAAVSAVHRGWERDGEVGDAERVARGGGVA